VRSFVGTSINVTETAGLVEVFNHVAEDMKLDCGRLGGLETSKRLREVLLEVSNAFGEYFNSSSFQGNAVPYFIAWVIMSM